MSDQTSSIGTRGAVHSDGLWFRDEAARTLLRREPQRQHEATVHSQGPVGDR